MKHLIFVTILLLPCFGFASSNHFNQAEEVQKRIDNIVNNRSLLDILNNIDRSLKTIDHNLSKNSSEVEKISDKVPSEITDISVCEEDWQIEDDVSYEEDFVVSSK